LSRRDKPAGSLANLAAINNRNFRASHYHLHAARLLAALPKCSFDDQGEDGLVRQLGAEASTQAI